MLVLFLIIYIESDKLFDILYVSFDCNKFPCNS